MGCYINPPNITKEAYLGVYGMAVDEKTYATAGPGSTSSC